ncbi:hypothetical protein FQN54_000084 [Arachnomyces sp. PD_36]|nr:hypothetical protein FQN54_000084 [Arachnomyces sp. PD_36]
MSRKFKSQASSSRAASGALGGSLGSFGGFSAALEQSPSSLSYIAEPPDLTKISEPKLVVPFKNLLKKDSTTKAKALEDLQVYISSVGNDEGLLEDSLLEAWVGLPTKLYPRASIDTSRRVRQLAHTLQGTFATSFGKRIARYVPKVIGAWLAGLYDNDKLVLKAARDSFILVFSTEEKRKNVWKVYQSSILEFVEDAILHQTPLTLSDERTIKPDEAEAKHARVVATATLLLNRLLDTFSPKGSKENLTSVQILLSNKALWSFSHHADPFVRRSIYSLLRTALSVDGDLLDWKIISVSLISKTLSIDQSGSSSDLSEALLDLTRKHPQIWTDDYAGKTSAYKRLCQYLRKGSQSASPIYWQNVYRLLREIPVEVLSGNTQTSDEGLVSFQSANSLMETFHEGIMSKDEHRGNLTSAWTSFVQTSLWLLDLLPDGDARQQFLQAQIIPILEKYVVGGPSQSQWNIPAQSALEICTGCVAGLTKHPEDDVLRPQWIKFSKSLAESLNRPSPKDSQDNKSSQDLICAQANHLFSLQAEILSRIGDTDRKASIYKIFEEAILPLLEDSITILRSKNGSPYGAAVMVEEAVRKNPSFLSELKDLGTFLDEDVPNLLFSPSAPWLVSILLHCQGKQGFSSGLDKSIDKFLNEKQKSTPQSLQKFLSSVDYRTIPEHPQLEFLVMQSLRQALRGNRERWNSINAVVENPTSRHGITDQILLSVVDSLASDDVVLEALHGISKILSQNKPAIRDYRNGPHGSKLLSKLLYLSESPIDEVASLADSLNSRIKELVTGDEGTKSTVEVIQQNFNDAGDDSLSVDSLVGIAQEVLSKAPVEQRAAVAVEILPSREQWDRALEIYLGIPPKLSSAITNALGGAVYLVDEPSFQSTQQSLKSISRDSNNFTSVFRLTYYVTKVFSNLDTLALINKEQQKTLFSYLPIAAQLIDDAMSIESSNGIVGPITPEVLEEGMDLVSEARVLIKLPTQQDEFANSNDSEIIGSWRDALDTLNDYSTKSYHLGNIYAKSILQMDLFEAGKPKDSWANVAKRIRESADSFWPIAILTAFKDSIAFTPAGIKLCNKLVADATGLDPERKGIEGLRRLILLNVLIQGEDSVVERVPTQRLVFLVKHLIQCFEFVSEMPGLALEVLKLLTSVLPHIREVYGTHWDEILEFLETLWCGSHNITDDEYLPVLHVSLRLFACMRNLASGDSNDDLEDAWEERRKRGSRRLVEVLNQFDASHTINQPRNITADLLARQISTINIDDVEDMEMENLFPILPVQNWGIQKAAYDILHRYIPKKQEQVSFDQALSKSAANLPDELLSLLLEVPKIETFSRTPVEDSQWLELRCYLLSWKVVFDHFTNSSLAVKESYATNIKDNACLIPLLEFTFDFLKHSVGKAIDASKFDICSFEPNQADTPQRESEWLLVHLYYLGLKFLPNLTKSWWIDSKKRIKGPIESWTQKYISPLIIESSLKNVSEWMSTQSSDEELPLEVKISPKSAELIASIEVDEDSPPISLAISLPAAYPLQPALVVGRHRVAVDEKKWRSWLLTIQGVIMFSNGDLVDGLLAFRKNVQGALKGQSECAICYSIISADMQTPNKRCGTCKNTFHSSCLFRWFKSSNSSGCPLCRNNFIYS